MDETDRCRCAIRGSGPTMVRGARGRQGENRRSLRRGRRTSLKDWRRSCASRSTRRPEIRASSPRERRHLNDLRHAGVSRVAERRWASGRALGGGAPGAASPGDWLLSRSRVPGVAFTDSGRFPHGDRHCMREASHTALGLTCAKGAPPRLRRAPARLRCACEIAARLRGCGAPRPCAADPVNLRDPMRPRGPAVRRRPRDPSTAARP